jgi:methyl-accepting chemotaxis protein
MAKKASSNTDHAVKIANSAIDKADRGKETINNMLESIEVVAGTNQKVADRMSRIRSEISEITSVISKISDKTSVINDIVFQTKLLSFNASVEAARAGEHGKGFSVLAQEIGNLASMSGSSSEEITEILQSGTETVNEIIKNTEKDMKILVDEANFNIDKAVKVGAVCEESMQEIFENINTVINMMNEIHLATREQAQGISLANESVLVLSSQSSQYKRVSQTSKDIASQLSGQLVSLKRVVGFLEQTASGQVEKNIKKS